MRDDFGRAILEDVPKMEEDKETHEMKQVFDDFGNPVYDGTREKINPDYDNTQKYVSRFDRKEWSPIGMLGVLSVCQDGTLDEDGYCTVAAGGIATKCKRNEFENCYRVIKVLNENVARVIFR
jgi:hypothetical protein